MAALTPCKQKHPLKLSAIHQLRTAVLWFGKGSVLEAGPSCVLGDNCVLAFLRASDETDWGVLIKMLLR